MVLQSPLNRRQRVIPGHGSIISGVTLPSHRDITVVGAQAAYEGFPVPLESRPLSSGNLLTGHLSMSVPLNNPRGEISREHPCPWCQSEGLELGDEFLVVVFVQYSGNAGLKCQDYNDWILSARFPPETRDVSSLFISRARSGFSRSSPSRFSMSSLLSRGLVSLNQNELVAPPLLFLVIGHPPFVRRLIFLSLSIHLLASQCSPLFLLGLSFPPWPWSRCGDRSRGSSVCHPRFNQEAALPAPGCTLRVFKGYPRGTFCVD